MENKNILLVVGGLVVLVVLFMLVGRGQDDSATMEKAEVVTTTATTPVVEDSMMEEEDAMGATIVDIAVGNEDFETLVTAVTEAGLVETLSGEGPFTVFAPTDEAFEKLPAGTIESLLADKDALTKVLTYHVVSGKVMAKDVVDLTSATTVEGSELKITVNDDGTVMINDSMVVTADIEATNGVIHVIDTVLLPE